MTNVVKLEETYEESVQINNKFSHEQIDIMRNSVAPNLDDDQFKTFLYLCHRNKLDPIAKQVYPLLKWDKASGKNQLSTIISIDGLRLIADRTGKYAPGKPTLYDYDDKGFLRSATAFVKKFAGGEWHDVSYTAFFSEFAVSGKNGLTPKWASSPHIMLSKCAEANSIRKAFPADTSGLYSDAEEACIMQNSNAVQKPQEKLISKEKFEEVSRYLEDKSKLKSMVLQFCKISKLEDMKEYQLEPCNKFVQAKLKQLEVEDENS